MNKKYIQGGKHYINNVYVYMKAIIFGAAGSGERLFDMISEKYEIIAAVDNDESKKGKYLRNIEIFMPYERLMKNDYDMVVLTSIPGKGSILDQLKKYGISENKIDTSYIDQPLDSRRIFCENMCQLQKNISNDVCVAEAGVFQGDFAKIINKNYCNKKLYLFDTFEGFNESDIEFEKKGNLSNAKSGDYSSTNEELVIEKMIYPENCIIKKGFFPNTTSEIYDKFCFVNLDMDLYKPTLMGLEWFGDRMVKGGCILIHDYFSETFMGVKEAVDEYLEMHSGLYKLPIGDGISVAIIGY